MNGLTGYNKQEFIKNIAEFEEAMNYIANELTSAGQQLFEVLRSTWYSPKAVEFSKEFSSSLYTFTVLEVLKGKIDVCGRAVDALNVMAAANNDSLLNIPTPSVPTGESFGDLLATGPDGSVGMAAQVVTAAANEYKSNLDKALSLLDSVPTGIAVFDPSGGVQEVYTNYINRIKNAINEVSNAVMNSLTAAIQEEESNINNAASQSAEFLTGMVSTALTGGIPTNAAYNVANSVANQMNNGN